MLLLCIKIFLVRIVDVSLGTIRTIFTVKGKKFIASCIGFFEILVWFLIVKEALQTEDNSIFIAIAYALGFATGTYIGSLISSYLINSNISIQVFTENFKIVNILRENNFAVSVIECKGYNNSLKYMLYINVETKNERRIRKIIEENDKSAFIVENETNYVMNGYFK